MRSIAIILTALLLWTGTAAAAITPLVDVDWIKENGGRDDVVILDVRNKLDGGSKAAYAKGHIPGAIYSNYLTAGWRKSVDGIIAQLPPRADLEALIGGLGIGNEDQVVIVAGGTSALDMGSATRIYFTFKVLGHDKVSILNGGYRAYVADPANRIETGVNQRPPTIFEAGFRPEMLADRTQVAAALQAGTPLLDIRPPPQYRGEWKHPVAKRAGTIPGAVSFPEGRLTEDGGYFITAERVSALLLKAGLEPDGFMIAFCNTGHWASLGWFVNSEILGNKQVKLYDGSMVDWTADDQLPVACLACRAESD